jgi:hypothetical protein
MVEAIHLQLLLATFADWATRRQSQVVEVRDRLGGLLKYYYGEAA